MENKKIIEDIVYHVWPDQSVIVGPTVINDICLGVEKGDLQFLEAEGGADFNASDTVQILIEGTTLVKICLEIYKLLPKSDSNVDDKKLKEKIGSDTRIKKIRKEILNTIPDIIKIIQKLV